ncbi:uncharacterized protein UHO2_00459 [Ustilago hordei]|uniref:uncharacterized protein n=1 Tax=Ustilago hordei TaxID=120017 RepID=UPI001A558C24|nr:uncharacterized protein UHO2_00455 [Ustilago hordei]XP_041413013.1 uncharacterized protein UHO2_00459 [Ustilago hordei]SYW81970.1 uncharacterized protein UHO2_00455 [Ustilago hordei]SYW81974.1 uncharacterized protein UHO2_00459 [Ustilago hordei]
MEGLSLHIFSLLLTLVTLLLTPSSLHSFNMTSSTDDSHHISAELLCQSTTPTISATHIENVPALSQSGSTSTSDIHTSCPTQASRSATGKKNFTWSAESDPALKLCIHPIFWEISKMFFPGASVNPNCIKAKLRWLLETYYREKKKLSLTGAGMLLEDMDASNLSYISCIALSTKYTWFKKMHKMMNGQFYANPTALITTPSLDFTSDDKADMPSYSSADIPMDLSGSEPYDHGTHSHAQLSPSTKHKQGALDHKCNTLAEAFYHSSIDTLQICLQLEQEHTRCKKILEAEHTKHEEMHMQHEREEKECDECIHVCDHEMVMEMVCLLASQASSEQDAHQNTSNNNNMDSSFNLPVL